MWIKNCLQFLFGALVISQTFQLLHANNHVTYLEPGQNYKYSPETAYFTPDLRIYCYRGSEKSLANFFQSISVQLNIDNDDYVQYEGETPEVVEQHYKNQRSIFSFSILNTSKKKLIKVNPFNQTCVGIESPTSYGLQLNFIRINFWKVILLGIGLFIFLSAKKLSQTPLFYYLSGVFLGIFASFLIVVYFTSKLLPKRPMMYGMMVGGWTLGIYFIQMLLENLQVILMTYQTYVFWYILTTGFCSFIVCYRAGPPKNQRSKDLIKWGLQLLASVMIFYSSNYREASVALMLLVWCWYYFPVSIIQAFRGYWRRKFPPKPKLLSSEEYYEQGVRETTRALEELKRYCSSPESKPWRTMTKLKDPQRFASFMEGTSHINDEEILEYETTQIDNQETDDDNSDDTTDNEDANDNNGNVSDDNEADFENHLNDRQQLRNGLSSNYKQRITKSRISPRTSTPTLFTNTIRTPRRPSQEARNSTKKENYRRYNRTVEISDDDDNE